MARIARRAHARAGCMAGNARRGCGVLVLRAAMQCAFEREGAAACNSRGNQAWHAATEWATPRFFAAAFMRPWSS